MCPCLFGNRLSQSSRSYTESSVLRHSLLPNPPRVGRNHALVGRSPLALPTGVAAACRFQIATSQQIDSPRTAATGSEPCLNRYMPCTSGDQLIRNVGTVGIVRPCRTGTKRLRYLCGSCTPAGRSRCTSSIENTCPKRNPSSPGFCLDPGTAHT